MPSEHRPPVAGIRHLVDCLWVASEDLSRGDGFVVTPDQFVELLIFGGHVAAVDSNKECALPACVLLGPLTRTIRLTSNGRVRCAGIRIQPWAVALSAPKRTRAKPWADGSELVGPALLELVAALRSKSTNTVFKLLHHVAGELPLRRSRPTQALISSPLSKEFSPGTLSGALGVGRRQAARRFKSWTTLSPKQFSGLARLQFVRDQLWLRPQMPLSILAADAGYADQAHMTRDFRKYAGQTPAAFARPFRIPSPTQNRSTR